MSEKIAFIGLGVMGYPMAGFLAKAGYKVTVYNRTIEKAKKWVHFNKINYFKNPSNFNM